MNDIYIKKASDNIIKELNAIAFDSSYLCVAAEKYNGELYKIFNLKPHEANILKQICLSLGFDCAVSRDTIMCKCDYTNAILFASVSQLKNLYKKLIVQPFRLTDLAICIQELIKNNLESLFLNNVEFDWTRPYIMGILNVTPDSFSDGGKYNDVTSAVQHVKQMINDGADIIDIGAESTRPDSVKVSVQEEINRLIPIIKAIRENNITIPISVDTRNYETAKKAIEVGANLINDVTGLDYDENLFNYVVENNLPVIIMHSDKVPANSSDFSDSDIVEEVYYSLKRKIDKLLKYGLNKKNVIIDVGIGFGKNVESNFELIKRMEEFTSLKVPVALGLSRKSFMRKKFNLTCEEADIPTALYSSIVKGVNIHRVHNVKLTKTYLSYSSLIHD